MAVTQPSISGLSLLPSAKHRIVFSAPSNFSFGRRSLFVTCLSTPSSDSAGCCGGSNSSSSSSSGSGSCSSHGKAASSLAKVGKEFEQMVASATLDEYEKNYIGKPMEGTISRDIIEEVMQTFPDGTASQSGARSEAQSEEKFLDVNALLDEARSMSKGNFVFSDDEDMVLI